MRNDTLVTEEVGQQYVAAHAAHYGSKDLREALTLYKALLAAHPDTREAGYSRSQIQNIVKVVVSDQTLSDAHVDLATAHLEHGDRPDVWPVPVASPAQRRAPAPSSSRSARQAGAHQVLVLLLGLCLFPAVATAQADVAEVPGHAHAQRYGVGWECDWGYRTADQSCEAITVPAHAHLNAFGGRWDCDRGVPRRQRGLRAGQRASSCVLEFQRPRLAVRSRVSEKRRVVRGDRGACRCVSPLHG